MLTILPHFRRRIVLETSRHKTYGATRLVSTTVRQLAVWLPSSGERSMTPALLTRMSGAKPSASNRAICREHGFLVRDVQRERDRFPPLDVHAVCQADERIAAAGRQDDARAGGCQRFGGHAADAPRRAGNQSGSAAQVEQLGTGRRHAGTSIGAR